jgi:hypothetical protein
MGKWMYSSTNLYFETRWRWVISLTPRPLYPPQDPMERRFGKPQRRYGRREKSPLPRIELVQSVKNSSLPFIEAEGSLPRLQKLISIRAQVSEMSSSFKSFRTKILYTFLISLIRLYLIILTIFEAKKNSLLIKQNSNTSAVNMVLDLVFIRRSPISNNFPYLNAKSWSWNSELQCPLNRITRRYGWRTDHLFLTPIYSIGFCNDSLTI